MPQSKFWQRYWARGYSIILSTLLSLIMPTLWSLTMSMIIKVNMTIVLSITVSIVMVTIVMVTIVKVTSVTQVGSCVYHACPECTSAPCQNEITLLGAVRPVSRWFDPSTAQKSHRPKCIFHSSAGSQRQFYLDLVPPHKLIAGPDAVPTL